MMNIHSVRVCRAASPFLHATFKPTATQQQQLQQYSTTRLGRIDLNAKQGSSSGSSGSSNASTASSASTHSKQPQPKKESIWRKIWDGTISTGYLGVILAGVGAGGLAISYVVSDFIEGYHAEKLFDDAFDKVQRHPQVVDMVGLPMRGHGGKGPRGGETKVTRTIYKDDQGADKMVVMYFALEGPNGKGTVYVNQVKNPETDEYEYNVLSADVQRHGMRSAKRFVLIDNRTKRRPAGGKKGWFGMKPLWRGKE
ncbi:hypothetical protein HDU81_011197 [Chytriomyces hyalinus]|nr:hypothetical protein HDU81_011197 [Chytriomyces hyalinus]